MKIRADIRLLPISDLTESETNAKQHTEAQIEVLSRGIERFGFNVPLVVSKDKEIIAGHGRLHAARKLGLSEVPCIVAEDLTHDEIEAYRLADNQINAMTKIDMGMVIESLKYLDTSGFDVTLTGFSKDLLLEPEAKDDEVPIPPPVAKSQTGAVYTLGKHRVMCGDSTLATDVKKLMQGQKADMVFTDPPYNIAYEGRGENTSIGIAGDDVTDDEFKNFLHKVFANYNTFSKDSAGHYIFHASHTQIQFEEALRANGYVIKNQLIWNKPMAAMGWGDYRWKHEPFFYAGKADKPLDFYADRTKTTVWDFQKSDKQLLAWARREKESEVNGKTTIWSMKRDNVNTYLHPTQKPVELIVHALANSSQQGEIIFDLFLGSGSTLIASEKAARIYYGMEIDPRFVDVIIQRWQDYTGKKAICDDGTLWDAKGTIANKPKTGDTMKGR